MSDLQLLLEPPIARVVLNRPERRNALSEAMWNALEHSCALIEDSPDISAVVVEGSGGHFCAGADISEFEEVFADIGRARIYLAAVERALNALSVLDRPVIAKLEGSVVGGGLAVALACDLRYVDENAHLAIPPAKLGFLYGVAETRLLVETVGASAAKDLLFSARAIRPSEALALGLVSRVLPGQGLADAVQAQAWLWTQLSGASIRGAKRAVRAIVAAQDSEARTLLETVAMGSEFREGRSAFREKRAPVFARNSPAQ